MTFAELINAHRAAEATVEALPLSDRAGLEAAAAVAHAAVDAIVAAPAASLADLAAKVELAAQQHADENDAVVAALLASIQADISALAQ